MVPRLALKPHLLYDRCFSAMVSTSLFSNTLANILQGMERRNYPVIIGAVRHFPLFFYRVMMTASRKSCGSFPCSQQQTKNSWSLILSAGPPFSQISAEMPSIPAAFSLLNCFMAFSVVCSVEVLSNSVFTGCCGMRSNADR